jgi:hypothetical protein
VSPHVPVREAALDVFRSPDPRLRGGGCRLPRWAFGLNPQIDRA